MKLACRFFSGLILSAVISFSCLGLSEGAKAEQINIRIASGHPPTVVYAGLMLVLNAELMDMRGGIMEEAGAFPETEEFWNMVFLPFQSLH